MAATKDLLTVDSEHNGDTSDYHHSDMDENYEGTLQSKYSNLGKNDSLKSTRSLSVFRDPNASKTMARSEEMTYNIYEDIEGEPSTSAKAGRMYSKSEASRQRGTFQIKTATSPTAVPPLMSDSLRSADFKASLANTLTRRLSSEGNISGSEGRQNGFSHLVSMDPAGRSSAKGSSSVSNTLESTGSKTTRKDQWNNSLSSATSTSTLTSVDGVGTTADMRGGMKPLVDLSQSEAETDNDRNNSGRRGGYSSDQDSEVVSHSLPRYSPAEIDVSNSKVKDQGFKAKMAALFGGSGTTSPVSTSAPGSLVRSRKGIEKLDSSDHDTESRTSTLSRDLREVATPAESLHSTLEGRASDAQSQRSTTPSDLRDVITQGKVNRLAGELAIRGVPLTGRSMDASSVSSMERPSSRASNQSGLRDQSKKFKYEVEGIDRPSESEANTTMESEDDAGTEQKRKMRVNLLQEIKNHSGTVEPSTNSGGGGVQSDGRSKDGDTPPERESSPVLQLREETTTTTKALSVTSTSAGQNNDRSVDNNIDERSIQSESDETDATLEDEPPLLMRSSVGGSTQMSGRSDHEGTSVSVEITDGSETGHSYNLEDAAIRRDDEPRRQDENDSATDEQQTIGEHVVTLHLTGDNDAESNDRGSLPVEEEEDTAADERKDQSELNQAEYSSSASAGDSEQRPLRHRMTAADRMSRIPSRPLSEDEPRSRAEDRDVVTPQRNVRDGTLDYEEIDTQLTEGSDYSGRQRGQFGGRPKINNKTSNVSTSESYVPLESQRPRIAAPDTSSGFASSSRPIESQRPTGRRIIITGRENIRRITPMNDLGTTTVVQNGIGHRELGRELSDDSGGYPQPSPRKSIASDVPNAGVSRDRAPSFDRQMTSESVGQISFSSDDFPEATTAPSPVWTPPRERDVGTARDGNNGSLIIRVSPDHDASLNSRRSLTDSERGHQGLYEQNRRRSRQRRPSRQVTDSSLTDQEDFENAGHRSSVMRRRMKRHMSRQSVESDTEDPAIYSEPEYIHRETHVTQTSVPVSGLISYGRSSSRPTLASEITRSPSVPPPSTRFRPSSAVHLSQRSTTPVTGRISYSPPTTHLRPGSAVQLSHRSTTPVTGQISYSPPTTHFRPGSAVQLSHRSTTPVTGQISYSPPTTHFRPSSAVQLSHRSTTPVTGRISVSRTTSRPNVSRSATPVAGLISVQNGSRPRSAMDSIPMNYPGVINSHNLAYPPNSPTGNSYMRSVNVVSPDSAELVGVDPELRDAQKTGNIYHITMSLRPIVNMSSRPGSVMQTYELVDTAIRSVPRRPQSVISNGPRTSWLLTEDDLGFPNQSVRPTSSAQMSSNQYSSSGHASQNPVAFHLELQGGETIQKQSISSHKTNTGGDTSFVVDLGRNVDMMEEETNGPTTRSRSEKMPNIVRGSMLIKNSFDTTNRPQVIDVVETEDDDDATVIEDNSNMFHGRYMLRKENPLYSSNPDLNRLDDDDDNFQAEFVPAEVDEADSSPARMRVDRGGIGRVVKGTRSTGDQGPAISNRTQSTDYIMPDVLEFESLPNSKTTITTKTTTTNRHAGSGYKDDFDRDVMVTRDGQKNRSKSSLGHSEYFGHMQNGDASGSMMMNGGGGGGGGSMMMNGGGGGGGGGYMMMNGGGGGSMMMNGGGTMSDISMTRTSQFATSASRASREQNGAHDPYKDEDFNTEVKVNRDYWLRQRDRASSGGQASMKMMSSSFAKQHQSQSGAGSLFVGGHSSSTLDWQSISSLNIRSLMVGTSSSVKQTIKVDRLEDEILNSLPADELRRREEAGLGADVDPASAIFDFDKVSEQVDMDISDGKVTLTSRARSERMVPIMGSEDMYKKSAVIVTKAIEIDMTLTPQRRQLYEMIVSRQNGRNGTTAGTLDKKETLELYKQFSALAEFDRAIAK